MWLFVLQPTGTRGLLIIVVLLLDEIDVLEEVKLNRWGTTLTDSVLTCDLGPLCMHTHQNNRGSFLKSFSYLCYEV